MTTETDMQRMAPLVPLIDQLKEIACEELPEPRSCEVKLWDDGDYHLRFYHNRGQDESYAIHYDTETGDVVWRYQKNVEWVVDEEKNGEDVEGTPYMPEFEEYETRTITTIKPPVER